MRMLRTSAAGAPPGVPQPSPDPLQATQIMDPCAGARLQAQLALRARIEGLCRTCLGYINLDVLGLRAPSPASPSPPTAFVVLTQCEGLLQTKGPLSTCGRHAVAAHDYGAVFESVCAHVAGLASCAALR